jgi:cysteinyl-tRNA synthetase
MITINGQKMGKSLGNFITLDDLFNGTNEVLEKAYSPMTIRFFILQAHYRSTLDFSNEALQAAEKGLAKLMKGVITLNKIKSSATGTYNAEELKKNCYDAMNDDLNSPIVIANLFDALKTINSVDAGSETIDAPNLDLLKQTYHTFLFDILGLMNENQESGNNEILKEVVDMVLNLRMTAKANKDYATSDFIRNELTKIGITVKDKKDGFEWEV